MPACESKLVSRSSRKATVAKAALIRPRSCDHKPSLVGDHGPVFRVLGCALTRMCNRDIRGRGGANDAYFHL